MCGTKPSESCGADAAPALRSIDEIKKMRIKEIRALLAERGLACSGCAEKADYEQLFFAKQAEPVKPPEPEKEKEPEAEFKRPERTAEERNAEFDELLARMKSQGFGDGSFSNNMGKGTMFSQKDLENMTQEEIRAKLSVPGRRARKGQAEAAAEGRGEGAREAAPEAAPSGGSGEGESKAEQPSRGDAGDKRKAEKKGDVQEEKEKETEGKSGKGKGKGKGKDKGKNEKQEKKGGGERAEDKPSKGRDKSTGKGDKEEKEEKARKPSMFKKRPPPGMPREKSGDDKERAEKAKAKKPSTARAKNDKRAGANRRRKYHAGTRPEGMEGDGIVEEEYEYEDEPEAELSAGGAHGDHDEPSFIEL